MRKLLLLLFCGAAFGQAVRYDLPPVLNSRGVPIANPNISLCTGLATINGTTCSIQATSFTDITLAIPCAGGSPVTLANSNVCRATGDALGNGGFWLSPGAYIYCVTAPSTTGQCYNLTVPVGTTAAGGATAVTGILSVPATGSSINAVYATCPATGGVVHVPPGYTENPFTAVAAKANCSIVFDGTATLTSANTFFTNTTNVNGFALIGPNSNTLSNGNGNNAAPVRLVYTGTGTCVNLGISTSPDMNGPQIDNIMCDISGAGASAIGFHITRAVFGCQMRGLVVQGQNNGTNTQIGLQLDGTGNFTGCQIDDPTIGGVNTPIQFTGSGTQTANFNQINHANLIAVGASPKMLDFQGGNGNTIFANSNGSTGTLVNMASLTSNTFNKIGIYNCGETTFANLGALTSNNSIEALSCSPVGKITDSGTSNSFPFLPNLSVSASGLLARYNNIPTVSSGIPSEVATVFINGQNNNIGTQTLYTTPASGIGLYRLSCYEVVTTAAATSSTLPQVNAVYTDSENSTLITVQVTPAAAGPGTTGTSGNALTTMTSGSVAFNAKASTTISWTTTNYASNAANAMVYSVHCRLEALGQ